MGVLDGDARELTLSVVVAADVATLSSDSLCLQANGMSRVWLESSKSTSVNCMPAVA